jgi:CubicO group peptidase (beta-lactamase class C family)
MNLPAGIVSSRLDDLLERARREVDEGRLPGFQLAVGFEREVVYAEAYGEAREDERFHTYSAVKPTVSLTVLELAAEGLFNLDDPVASILETFGTNGKERITISQVLLHKGGFPSAPMAPRIASDRTARLQRYGTWYTNWEPGTRFEYHPSSAHWILADLIEEVSGRPYADVITERLMEPAGQTRWLAIPEAEQGDITDVYCVGEPVDPIEYEAQFGVALPVTEVTDDALTSFNDAGMRALGQPGGGGITTASGFASWYQAILHDSGEILRAEVKQDALAIVRQTHEDHMGISANRTHAFILAGDDGRASGRGHAHTVSPMTFGHGGARGQLAWADPVSGVSFGFMTHGLERHRLHEARRSIAISTKAGLLTTPVD